MKSSQSQLLKKLVFNPQRHWTEDKVLFKDCSVRFLLKHNPQLTLLIEELSPFLGSQKYLTFDYQEINQVKTETNSCKDISWHVDGINNQYLIMAWGDQRTLFLNDQIELNSSEDLMKKNSELKKIDLNLNNQELSNGHLYMYDSNCIHRGQTLYNGQKRIFFRVCMSDYISPKNKIFK